MSRHLRAFKRWMRSQGIDCSDALEFTEDKEGITVQTRCDLREGDLIATIPKSACLTIKTSAAHKMIEDAGLAGYLGLSVAVMCERSIGHESIWYGYLQLLPEKECVPLVWSLEEVDILLSGTELQKIVKEDKTLLYEDWKECILPLVASGSSKLNPDGFGIEHFFAVRSLVSSRSFEIDDYHGFGMVPLADLFNHKTGAENVHFTSVSSHSVSDSDNGSGSDEEYDNLGDGKPTVNDLGTGYVNSNNGAHCPSNSEDNPMVLEMIIVKDVKAGDEVFNTYGSMGNAALLHRYGFTEPDNPFDIVNIDLSLVLQWSSSLYSNRYSRARLSLWRRLEFSGCVSQNSEYFEISFDGQPQLELLILLYIISLPEEPYAKLNLTLSSLGKVTGAMSFHLLTGNNMRKFPETTEKTMELFLTEIVCGALVSLADMRESFYGLDSMKDDLNALKRCCRVEDRKLYHSLVLRVSERRILEKLRSYASRPCTERKRKL